MSSSFLSPVGAIALPSVERRVRPAAAGPSRGAGAYIRVLGWAFAFFNGVRLATYLPTIWAIQGSGASDQHSLLTWLAWCGANVTMALTLHEQNGRRFSWTALVNCGNAAMCAVTCIFIAVYR